jgi:tetratricopeptide (TPR) repeat protein
MLAGMWRVLGLVLLSCALARGARAQDADALIDEGIALREAGRDTEALARFEQAYALSPDARGLAQIALAEQALGRFADAEAHLRGALASDADRFIRRNRALLEGALDELARHIGELSLVGGVEGARVRIDGRDRGTLPLPAPLRLATGTARVEVEADGHAPFAGVAMVRAGETTTLIVSLEPRPTEPAVMERAATAPALAPPPEDTSRGWLLPTGIALVGGGAVGIGVGIALQLVREDHARARLGCSDAEEACRARYGAALEAEAGATAGFVVGALLAAGGAAVLLVGALSAPAEAPVACAPSVLGAVCAGRF